MARSPCHAMAFRRQEALSWAFLTPGAGIQSSLLPHEEPCVEGRLQTSTGTKIRRMLSSQNKPMRRVEAARRSGQARRGKEGKEMIRGST
jgi:hypothetical protein